MGKYVTFHLNTAEFEIDNLEIPAGDRAYERFGEDAPMYTMRVGGATTKGGARFSIGRVVTSDWTND